MLQNSKLAISAAALLFAGVQAQHEGAPAAPSNCTGVYYHDINAAFYECLDERGVLESKSSVYYQSLLEHECSNVTYGNLTAVFNGTQIQGNFTQEEQMEVCDYFQWGKGYEFSWVNHDIGLIHIHEKVGNERSLYFQNETNDSSLKWDW